MQNSKCSKLEDYRTIFYTYLLILFFSSDSYLWQLKTRKTKKFSLSEVETRFLFPTLRKTSYWIKSISFQKHVYHGFKSICYRISNIFIGSCIIFLWINSIHAFGKKCFWFNSIFFSVQKLSCLFCALPFLAKFLYKFTK